MMCLAGLALLAFSVGNPLVGGLALLIIGAVLGFLRYNTYPARVFMGDSGSQLLGFCAAVLAVMLTQDATAPLSSALPLLLLGVPIIDTVAVITSRLLAGRSPFKADRNHIHHRLLALGFDHHEAVMVIYVMQAMLFLAAWFMRYDSDAVIVAMFAGFGSAIMLSMRMARVAGWRWRDHSHAEGSQSSPLQNKLKWLSAPTRLPRWSCYVIAVSMCAYAAVTYWLASSPAQDASLLATAMAVVLGLNVAVRWKQTELGWIDKGALYLCAVLLVYLSESATGLHHSINLLLWVFVALIALAVALRLRLQPDRRFIVTPLDVLVVIAAVLIPNLPGSVGSPHALGAAVVKLIVLFYGIETLNVISGKYWKYLSLSALIVLSVCAVRGL